ncbi:MAG: ribonuclease III family protein [Promethearchaeota archaeon]
MSYDFLIKDLDIKKSKKAIGIDKGLAKIGDGVVNLAFSMAKSIFLTKNNKNNAIIRTGRKVSKDVLANALKNAHLKNFAKNRADAHDMADTVEAIIAYTWINNNIDLTEIIDILTENLSGNLYNRREEIEGATEAFTVLLNHVKKYLPEI